MWIESEIVAGSGSSAASSSSGSSTSSKKGGRSQFERKLGDFFKHQIESDTSMAYGDGFRAGNRAVMQYGLKRTLEHIRLTGTFPFWNSMDSPSHFETAWIRVLGKLTLHTWLPLQPKKKSLYKYSFQNPGITFGRAKWKYRMSWLMDGAQSLTNHFVLWPNSGTKTKQW